MFRTIHECLQIGGQWFRFQFYVCATNVDQTGHVGSLIRYTSMDIYKNDGYIFAKLLNGWQRLLQMGEMFVRNFVVPWIMQKMTHKICVHAKHRTVVTLCECHFLGIR